MEKFGVLKRSLIGLATALVCLNASAAISAPEVELRAGAPDPADHPITVTLQKFSDLVLEKTNGKVKVHVFPQSLGAEHELVQGALSGSLDIGMLAQGNASRYTDAFLVLDLPFLFDEYDDLFEFMRTEQGRELTSKFEKDVGLKPLYFASFGTGRDISTRETPLRVPADIKGLKIRTVSSPVDAATFQAWGAVPTPTAWLQTFTSLQQGVIDGMNAHIISAWAGKYNEVTKHVLRINYQLITELVFMNPNRYQSLDSDYQKAIMESAAEAEVWGRKYATEQLGKVVDDYRAKGVQVYSPTKEEYAQWSAIREGVWERVAKEIPSIDLDLARKIRASAK